MQKALIHCIVWTIAFAYFRTATATEKVDILKVITKVDAEAVLGVPVKDAKGRNKENSDGFYDSEWSYYAVKGDKALVFDLVFGGKDAPPHLAATMFSVLPVGGGKSTKVEGLGEKAIFYHDNTGLEMMNVLKGDALLTIGVHGNASGGRARTGKIARGKNLGENVAIRIGKDRSEKTLEISFLGS